MADEEQPDGTEQDPGAAEDGASADEGESAGEESLQAEGEAGEPAEGDGETAAEGEAAAKEHSGPQDDDAVYDIPVELSAVLGTALIPVAQLLKMGRGAVLELDRRVGDPVDILVNKRMVARGDVVVVEDRLGVTLSEALRTSAFK